MVLKQIAKALADLNKEETISLTIQTILSGSTPQEIVSHGLFPGLEEVMKRYEKNDHLYPDMFKASQIFNESLAKIKHQITTLEIKSGITGAIGVVYGDMQDFGKNIVHMTLEANGFSVRDLGKSVPFEVFLKAAQEGVDFIGISIMTDEGFEEAKKIMQGLQDLGIRERVKLIVGGAGVNAQKASEILGADGYADNAEEVVEFLKLFFGTKRN